MYATSSMYSVCLLHALRYFKREQFLVLRYEDLMAMDAAATLRLLSRFTGLHLDGSTAARARGNCQPTRLRAGKRGKGKADAQPNAYSSSSPHAAEMLAEAAPHLEAVFAPYNALLRELLHPRLSWAASDHRKVPLSAEAKARVAEERYQRRLALRRQQVSRRVAQIERAAEVRSRISGAAAAAGRGAGRGAIRGARRRGGARRLPGRRGEAHSGDASR
mmetsp:Transcript_4326/g.13964  ORF Transcript_4326/g.13964 Transcript_4326/m.13964 type:complete len:219 (+) Transcript_4326:1563-2219(+)